MLTIQELEEKRKQAIKEREKVRKQDTRGLKRVPGKKEEYFSNPEEYPYKEFDRWYQWYIHQKPTAAEAYSYELEDKTDYDPRNHENSVVFQETLQAENFTPKDIELVMKEFQLNTREKVNWKKKTLKAVYPNWYDYKKALLTLMDFQELMENPFGWYWIKDE